MAFGKTCPSYFSPSLSQVLLKFITPILLISPSRPHNRIQKETRQLWVHTPAQKPPAFLKWQLCCWEYLKMGTKLKLHANNHLNFNSSSNIFPPWTGKSWSLTHTAGILFWNIIERKGKLYRARWKAPAGLTAYFGSSQFRNIIITSFYYFLNQFY